MKTDKQKVIRWILEEIDQFTTWPRGAHLEGSLQKGLYRMSIRSLRALWYLISNRKVGE
jgi:hypothetical protein